MNKKWWKESVIYQIYPRSFNDSNNDGIGDLQGIIQKLDYLKELGINVIWLSPVYKTPNDDNGYDISDYCSINEEFGTMEDFDLLLTEAHNRGIRIVMDLVVNHTSDEHEWFVESRSSIDNPKRDYYIWREAVEGREPNNWGSCFSGSAWEWDNETQMYYLHCFSKKQPDLNWENPEVRREVYDMMTWWCDKGIDGFRMDVISMISKKEGLLDGPLEGLYSPAMYGTCNGPRVHEFLREMNTEVLSKYDIMTVGETAGVTIEEAKKYAGSDGTELNMVFQFEHVGLDDGDIDKWSTRKIVLTELKENLSKWQNELDGVAWNSLFFSNHDQPRIVSRLGDGTAKSAKCIATMLHMMQGTPYIYQGEELGMTNYPFSDIGEFRDLESINAYNELVAAGLRGKDELFKCISYKSRDNARTPMQWSDSKNAGFSGADMTWINVNPNYASINAEDELHDRNSVFYYYKKLVDLRRNSKYKELIVYGHYSLLSPDDNSIFSYVRWTDDYKEKLLVICNFSGSAQEYTIPDEVTWKKSELLITNESDTLTNEPGRTVSLSPYGAAVWAIE